MTRQEIMNAIVELSYSQGMYGRLLRAIEEAPEDQKKAFFKQFEGCKDVVDFVMQLES